MRRMTLSRGGTANPAGDEGTTTNNAKNQKVKTQFKARRRRFAQTQPRFVLLVRRDGARLTQTVCAQFILVDFHRGHRVRRTRRLALFSVSALIRFDGDSACFRVRRSARADSYSR